MSRSLLQRLLIAFLTLLGSVRAAEVKPFPLAGGTVLLERADSSAGVLFRAFRPNRATGRWDVDVVVTNGSPQTLRLPLVLHFESAAGTAPGIVGTAADDAGQLFLDLTAQAVGSDLAPGAALPGFTLALGDGRTRPQIQTALYSSPARPPAPLTLVRTITADGLPLPGVAATEVGPDTPRTVASGRGGWLTLEARSGVRGWRFDLAGHEPVIRLASELKPGVVTELPSVRLAAASSEPVVRFPLHALPVPVPRGWSPAAVVRSVAGAQTVALAQNVPAGQTALLAGWDEAALRWQAIRGLVANGQPNAALNFPTAGLFAVLVPDAVPVAPRMAEPGEVVGGAVSTVGSATLSATGRVNPGSASASREAQRVTATATVELTGSAGPVGSGLVFPGQVTEEYRLRDGTRRQLPAYTLQLEAFRVPGSAASAPVTAQFPLRPFQLLAGEELAEAVIRVDVLAPTAFAGGVLDATGGSLADGPLRVAAAAGHFTGAEAAVLRRLSLPAPAGLVPAGLELVQAFELSVANVQAGKHLALLAGPVPPNGNFVLARAVFDEGWHGFQPIERLVSDAAGGLSSREPAAGERLLGVDGGGQYWLFQTAAANALVSGVVRDRTGQTAAGVVVRAGPWTAFTDAAGRYQLAAPAGSTELTLLDPRTDDSGSATLTVAADLAAVTANVDTASRGPRMLTASPADGAVNVPRVSSVTLTLSRALNPATLLGDAVKLTAPDGSAIPASVTLNLARTTITLLPSAELPANAVLKVTLAATVADPSGLPLEGPREFTFTTESGVLRRDDAELVIHEPEDGEAAMVGGAGLAEPESPVILVNETTGFTSTVLSKPDGSFSNSIPADVDDELVVVVVNRNGTRNRVTPSQQVFADGSVGLFAGGGTISAEGEGGTFSLGLPPGAIPRKTVFALAPVPLAQAISQLPEPALGLQIAAAVDVRMSGDQASGLAGLSVPFDPVAFGVPTDRSPTNMTFALAIVRLVDGEPAYQVVDEMAFRDGRLVALGQAPFAGWLDGRGQDGNPAMEFTAARQIGRSSRPARHFIGVLFAAEFLRLVVVAAYDPPIRMLGKTGLCLAQTESGCLEESLDAFFGAGNAAVGLVSTLDVIGDLTASGLSALANASRIAVPGAIVDAVPVTAGGGPPRFGRGVPYAVTDRGGQYGLLLPSVREVYIARARHPSQTDPVRLPVAPALENEFAHTVRKNFTFHAQTGLLLPPRLSVSQRPLFPDTNEVTTVFVDVIHPAAASATVERVTVFVLPLPGQTNLPAPTEADLVKSEPTVVAGFGGAGQKRFAVTLQASRPLRVDLRFRVTVTLGERTMTEITPWIVDLGAVPSGNNLAIQSDALDKVGPSLVRVSPLAGGTLPAGEPVRLFFNEPIDASVTNTPGAFTLTPSAPGGLALRLSGDQTVLEILPPALAAGTAYTLTLQTPVRDLAGNPLQSGSLSGLNVTVRFSTPAAVSSALPDIGQGGGAVTHENFVFALDRAGSGRLVVFNAAIPRQPVQVASVDLPGFPRDLEFVPNWSYFLRPPALFPGEPARTGRNLLLIVGGLTGTRDELNTNLDFQRQYLRVYDVTDPANPVRIASTELSQRPSVVQKVTWHPPEAAFFENEADFQQVAVLDLQAFINAYNLGLNDRIAAGDANGFVPGLDGSGLLPDGTTNTVPNGHYTDGGDKLPKWEKEPVEFYGRIFGFGLLPTDGTRRILDYAYDNRLSVGALAFSGGFETLVNGTPTDVALPPGVRIAWFGGQQVFAPSATFPLVAGSRPKRVHLEFQVNVGSESLPDIRNLAFVSLAPDADGTPKLLVLDVSDPLAPKQLRRVTLPAELGQPQSIYRLPDGQLALALTADALVLDPRLVLEPVPADGLHPMFRNRLPGAGSGNQTLSVSRVGVFATSLSGRSEMVQLEPRLRIVQFRPSEELATNPPTASLAGSAVLRPEAIKADPAKARAVLRALREVGSVSPASVNGLSANTPSLLPGSRAGHYYVLLEAPGGAGAEVRLGLQSLNRAGQPLRNKGRDFPAVRAVSAGAAAEILQTARPGCDAPVREFRAFRLSDDPKSAAFNTYLSEPFALVAEPTTLAKLEEIQAALPRAVLWSGHHLSAFIDPDMDNNPVLGPFAARITGFAGDGGELAIVPRTAATVETFPGTYLPGANPPPANGHEALPGTFGMVSAHNAEIRSETLDLSLPGRGMPLVFQRTIGGQDLYEGPFGRGWDFNYNQEVVPLRPQTFGSRSELMFVVASLTNASGGVTPFAKSGDLVFADGAGRLIPYVAAGAEPPPEVRNDPLVDQLRWKDRTRTYYLPSTNAPGVFDPIFEFQDGAFARLTPDGLQFWYDRTGRLTKIYDRHPANFHELQYNERGELIRVTDRAISDGSRFLELGHYRLANDPLFVSGLDERTANIFAAGKIARLRDYTGRVVDYEYDADGLLLRRRGIAGSDANEGSGARPEVTYLWSGCDGVMGGVTAGGDPSQQDSALFAANVNGTSKRVEGAGNGVGGNVQMEFPSSGTAKITGPDQAVTEFKFDVRGYPLERKETGPENGPAITTYGYNQHGVLTNTVDPLGAQMITVYDSANPVLRARLNVLRTERRPGPRGGPVLVTAMPTYDLRFNLPVGDTTDANGHRHTRVLSTDGTEIERIVHQGAGETKYRYNEFGQLLRVTSPDGLQSGYEYNAITGFPEAELRGGNRFVLGYDSTEAARHGRPTTITPPRGAALQITYDARLMPTEVRRGQLVLKRGYDANGNTVYLERKVSALDRLVERHKFNRINFLEKSTVAGVDVNGSAQELVTQFGSSAADAWRVRTITYPGGQIRSFDYDHLGLVRRITLGNYVEEFGRDVHGNILEFRQGGRLTRKYGYDGHDRPTNSVSFGQVGEERLQKSYFPGGELAELRVSDAKFGELSHLTVEEIDALGRVRKQTQKGSRSDASVTFEYPADGSGGGVITDGPRDRVESRHDAAGYPRSLSHALASVTLTPDGNGNLTDTLSNEGARTYLTASRFDELDHLFRLDDDLGTHTTLEPRLDGAPEKIFDGRGKRTDQAFSVLGELLQQIRPNGVQFNFRRDQNRQPTLAADAALKGHEHAYDTGTFRPTEFRLRSTQSFLFQEPNELNLPKKILTPGGSAEVGYDLQGRITSRTAEYAQGEPYKLTVEHDALGRLRNATYGANGQHSASFSYDLLGPLTEATYTESQGTFTVSATLYADASRETVRYPSGFELVEDRDLGARLTGVREPGGGDVYRVLRHVGVGERGEVALGGGVIAEVNRFDLRRRLAARTFVRGSDGRSLADLRYRYDAADNLIARQELHRHGRADAYEYDDGNRLKRADVSLRLDLKDAVRHSADGLLEPFGFKAGRFARTYGYDGQGFDLLQQVTTINPNPLTVAPVPFVATLEDPDASLFPLKLDGVERGAPDPLGNTISTRLLVAGAGGGLQRVSAQLKYSALAQLVRVERADGVVVEYEHQPSGLIHRRRVTGPGLNSDVALVWDEGRLIEEYERVGDTNRLRARYLYADEDSPFAADFADAGGQLRRHWYLRDALGSVVAVADSTGEVVERVQYDPWGQPVIEGHDTRPPQVAFVASSVNGEFILQFSEPVFPPLTAPAAPDVPGADGTLFTVQRELSNDAVKLVTTGGLVSTELIYEDDLPTGFAFGQIIRVKPQPTTATIVGLQVGGAFLVDEWGNPNVAETLNFVAPAPGRPRYEAPAGQQDTRPPVLTRSAVGSPMLFHGQFWDADAGLLYLRARFYDPSTGMFLQQDPMGYEDSPNLYLAFAGNPTTATDNSGLSIFDFFKKARGAKAVGSAGSEIAGAGKLKTKPGRAGGLADAGSDRLASSGGHVPRPHPTETPDRVFAKRLAESKLGREVKPEQGDFFRGVTQEELVRIQKSEGLVPRSLTSGRKGLTFEQALAKKGADSVIVEHVGGNTAHLTSLTSDLNVAKVYAGRADLVDSGSLAMLKQSGGQVSKATEKLGHKGYILRVRLREQRAYSTSSLTRFKAEQEVVVPGKIHLDDVEVLDLNTKQWLPLRGFQP